MLISEGKPLRDEEILQELPVGTTTTFYFRDLGPQISWGTVSVLTNTQTTTETQSHTALVLILNLSWPHIVQDNIQRPQKIFLLFLL